MVDFTHPKPALAGRLGWRIVRGSAEDMDAILALRSVVFGDVDTERLLPETWQWQFVENPAGRGWIRLAQAGARVVGQYALMPTYLQIYGRVILAAFSCDTMTSPAYQRQGMFTALAEVLYDAVAMESGVSVIWGWPNRLSHPGFISKLGWRDVTEFPIYVKSLHPIWRMVTPCSSLQRCALEPIERFGEEVDRLWAKHRWLAPIIQPRTSEWLNWRYGLPAFGYKRFLIWTGNSLAGFVVFRVAERAGHRVGAIVDMFPFPLVDGRMTREVLGEMERRAVAEGATVLTALFPRGRGALLRAGFLPVPPRFTPRPLRLGVRCQPQLEPVLQNPAKWWVTYGDTDLI